MYPQSLSNSFEFVSKAIPEWGDAADDMYEYYHLLTYAIDYFEDHALPDEALNQLKTSRELLIDTLAELIQTLPASSYAMGGQKQEWMKEFYGHTRTLQAINQQTEAALEQLQEQHPALKSWLRIYFDE